MHNYGSSFLSKIKQKRPIINKNQSETTFDKHNNAHTKGIVTIQVATSFCDKTENPKEEGGTRKK